MRDEGVRVINDAAFSSGEGSGALSANGAGGGPALTPPATVDVADAKVGTVRGGEDGSVGAGMRSALPTAVGRDNGMDAGDIMAIVSDRGGGGWIGVEGIDAVSAEGETGDGA